MSAEETHVKKRKRTILNLNAGEVLGVWYSQRGEKNHPRKRRKRKRGLKSRKRDA